MGTLVAVPSCGGGGGDQTVKYVGTWTFSSGELTPTCTLIAGVKPFSLGGLTVVFAKVDDTTISLGIGAACTVKFKVSGNNATVEPMQTCTLDAGPPLGTVTVDIQSWTLALSGDQIDNTIAGSVAVCSASGTAVLMRGAGDGGVQRPDGGGHDGAGSAGEGGTQEGGATDLAAEVASDVASDVAADLGSDSTTTGDTSGGQDLYQDDFVNSDAVGDAGAGN